MKKATLRPFIIDVICPYCEQLCGNPDDGSLMWETSMLKRNKIHKCTECDKEFKLPAKITGMSI